MNKTKSWFSKKKNQIDKPINRPIKKKERRSKMAVEQVDVTLTSSQDQTEIATKT